jgi:hypothetical protein
MSAIFPDEIMGEILLHGDIVIIYHMTCTCSHYRKIFLTKEFLKKITVKFQLYFNDNNLLTMYYHIVNPSVHNLRYVEDRNKWLISNNHLSFAVIYTLNNINSANITSLIKQCIKTKDIDNINLAFELISNKCLKRRKFKSDNIELNLMSVLKAAVKTQKISIISHVLFLIKQFLKSGNLAEFLIPDEYHTHYDLYFDELSSSDRHNHDIGIISTLQTMDVIQHSTYKIFKWISSISYNNFKNYYGLYFGALLSGNMHSITHMMSIIPKNFFGKNLDDHSRLVIDETGNLRTLIWYYSERSLVPTIDLKFAINSSDIATIDYVNEDPQLDIELIQNICNSDFEKASYIIKKFDFDFCQKVGPTNDTSVYKMFITFSLLNKDLSLYYFLLNLLPSAEIINFNQDDYGHLMLECAALGLVKNAQLISKKYRCARKNPYKEMYTLAAQYQQLAFMFAIEPFITNDTRHKALSASNYFISVQNYIKDMIKVKLEPTLLKHG